MTFVVTTASWGWPQWTYIGLLAFSLVCHAVWHGTPRANYNVGYSLIDAAVAIFLLVAGGFFS